jgi:peptidoglycan/xylan/chitin deacetylase (PgdA/CDA1 family)
MNLLRQVIKFAMTSLLPRHKWMVQGPRSASGVALTFDDGPHPEYTPRLLDELQRQNIVATFFVVGEAAERNPKLVQRMAAEGHAVGTHSYTHSEPRLTSTKTLQEELRRSIDLCANLIGYEPTLFRPPKGQLTLAKTLNLWSSKQTIVLWNQDPRDYQAGPEGIEPWVNRYQPSAGDIVLLHDIHPHCIAAIEPISQRVTESNLGPFVRIDEWLTNQQRAAPDRSSAKFENNKQLDRTTY